MRHKVPTGGASSFVTIEVPGGFPVVPPQGRTMAQVAKKISENDAIQRLIDARHEYAAALTELVMLSSGKLNLAEKDDGYELRMGLNEAIRSREAWLISMLYEAIAEPAATAAKP